MLSNVMIVFCMPSPSTAPGSRASSRASSRPAAGAASRARPEHRMHGITCHGAGGHLRAGGAGDAARAACHPEMVGSTVRAPAAAAGSPSRGCVGSASIHRTALPQRCGLRALRRFPKTYMISPLSLERSGPSPAALLPRSGSGELRSSGAQRSDGARAMVAPGCYREPAGCRFSSEGREVDWSCSERTVAAVARSWRRDVVRAPRVARPAGARERGLAGARGELCCRRRCAKEEDRKGGPPDLAGTSSSVHHSRILQ
jgi:hypothetical protein